jgi:hypothetical protein
MGNDFGSVRILWRSEELESSDHFVARRTSEGWWLEGTLVAPVEDEPAHIRYFVELDHGWLTQRAEVVVTIGDRAPRIISFETDGVGNWKVEGASAEGLEGCLDVDLGFSPATNTLQVRRLGLEVGESRTLSVAWLSFPELEVQPLTQTYTRLAADRWNYGDDEFTADLELSPEGFVLVYGGGDNDGEDDPLWRATSYKADRRQ